MQSTWENFHEIIQWHKSSHGFNLGWHVYSIPGWSNHEIAKLQQFWGRLWIPQICIATDFNVRILLSTNRRFPREISTVSLPEIWLNPSKVDVMVFNHVFKCFHYVRLQVWNSCSQQGQNRSNQIVHSGQYLACGKVAVYLWHLVAHPNLILSVSNLNYVAGLPSNTGADPYLKSSNNLCYISATQPSLTVRSGLVSYILLFKGKEGDPK